MSSMFYIAIGVILITKDPPFWKVFFSLSVSTKEGCHRSDLYLMFCPMMNWSKIGFPSCGQGDMMEKIFISGGARFNGHCFR